MIAIVDYGLGNLRSVMKALEKVGGTVILTNESEVIAAADAVVLPGVGAFHEGMQRLSPLINVLKETHGKKPFLGICLGMQMLMDNSLEHGHHEGLGFIPGTVSPFKKTPGYKIPHMGWNQIHFSADDPLFEGLTDGTDVYFVHSFRADTSPEYTAATTEYITKFASAVENGSTYGTQFHPEKSGKAGLKILKNFVEMI